MTSKGIDDELLAGPATPPLLEVVGLRVHFAVGKQVIRAVDGVSFQIGAREIVGLAGESGCGKSVTTQAILGLVPRPGQIVEGGVRFKGESILDKTEEELRRIRGGQISIVVQDALAALSPVLTVGEQVADVLLAHSKTNRRTARQRTLDMFRRVRIPDPASRIKAFPHEFSGGMQQRTVIASALICGPDLIIADEPTTALDVTIQLQVLALLREARAELGCAVLYISHDLAAVAQIADRVLIMYGGEIVESAPTVALFRKPEHPYTQALLASIPRLAKDPPRYLPAIPGMPPDPAVAVPGCKFADRCRFAADICRRDHPTLIQTSADRQTRCFLYDWPNSVGPQAKRGTPDQDSKSPLRSEE